MHYKLPLAPPLGPFRGEQTVGCNIVSDVLHPAPAPKKLGPLAKHLLDGFRIYDCKQALGGKPENEQRTKLIGPAAEETMEFLRFYIQGVSENRNSAWTR